MRFVIADDMRPARLYAKRILRDLGHDVVGEAVNGLEAVSMCAELRPDVVILDISMPQMPGDLAARAILDAKTARFVCMATSMRQGVILRPLRALGAHVVSKPFYPDKLAKEIREITDADEAASL